MGHEYTVEFRIYGRDIDPQAVTFKLNLQPCQTVIPGTTRTDGKALQGLWAFNGNPSCSHNSSLEEALKFVLDLLRPLRNEIITYKENAHLVWWCGHFQSSSNGGYSLSAALLSELADFGAELFVDNYFSEASVTEE